MDPQLEPPALSKVAAPSKASRRALRRSIRIAVGAAWDCFAWAVALLIFSIIRYDFQLSKAQWDWVIWYAVVVIVLQLLLGFATQFYLGRSRAGSFSEFSMMIELVFIIGFPVGVIMALTFPDFPRGIALVVPPLALIIMAARRWASRAIRSSHSSRERSSRALPDKAGRSEAMPVLIYGAGDLGHQVATLVDQSTAPPFIIRGFIDDDPAKRYLRVFSYRVKGPGDRLIEKARECDARAVVLAITNAPSSLFQRVSKLCESAGLELIVVPPAREMIGGKVTLNSLRSFNVADLLGRRPIKTDVSSVAHYIIGKSVFITGAGGSIGSELARQVSKLGPRKLVLLDRDESELHAVQLSINGNGLLQTDDTVLCDIRDYEALRAVMETHRPEVVFHAAALKHLPMLERFPAEGWKTNVLGSLNVLRCAHEVGVKHYVNISTDKAADASSVLGNTKRLAERLTAWYASEYNLPYLSVRFGNVLGSRGSVLYTFRAQIERGGPITVTHPDVNRFFMTIPEACELVLQAGAIGEPGDVMVLDMGQPVKIVDVAKRLIAESGKDIEISYTGLRPGEKMEEVLFSTAEERVPSSHPLIARVSVPPLDPDELDNLRSEPSGATIAETENPTTAKVSL